MLFGVMVAANAALAGPTTTRVESTLTPSAVGQEVTFTATLATGGLAITWTGEAAGKGRDDIYGAIVPRD
ncbi:hypothetical protein [Microbaculum sp. FT89]|uniref:hypothetical protein n=1 Tax=Microbaculum sp. FT89 TaxID=3447298 RepID=UPI003F5315A2